MSETFGTDLDNPSIADVARAVGLHAVRIEHAGELDEGLRTAVEHPGAALIEVMTERRELAIPRTSRSRRPRAPHSGRRDVLSGLGEEVLDVARTNVRELALR